MKRRPGLSSRPIEFMPRRFFFVVTREVAPCIMSSPFGQHSQQSRGPEPVSSSNPCAFFPQTAGIQFISLHDQLSQPTANRESEEGGQDDEEEFNVGILQTLRFNDFLTQLLTSRSNTVTSEHPSSSGSGGIHQYNPHYFFVRREKLAEVIKAIHLICRWRLIYLGLSPQEALAPFEHLPFLFTSFFAPWSTFQPPNLLGALSGIAKGVSCDLLVHTDLELWGLVRPSSVEVNPEIGKDDHDGAVRHADLLDLRVLAPVSRRFFICLGNRNRRRRPSYDPKSKTVDEANGTEPTVSLDNRCEMDRKSEDQHCELLASQLLRSRVSLTILLSDNSDYSEAPGTCNISERLISKGLTVLDLSAQCSSVDATFDDTSEIGTGPTTLKHSVLSENDENLVNQFLDACEQTPGTIAVSSSRSSSGKFSASSSSISAATCIGCYLMKHHNFTSQEAVGWIRYCRPEYISQSHQLFLDRMQPRMWREGELFRRRLLERKQSEVIDRSMIDDSDSAGIGSSINIGRISLGRESLLGTKLPDEANVDDSDPLRPRSRSRVNRHHRSHLSLHQHLQSSQQSGVDSEGTHAHGNPSLEELHTDRIGTPIASLDSSLSATPKQRRPLTQGSSISARRLHRSSDGISFARADFALLHKFVHQTTAPYSCSSGASGFRSSTASSSSGSSSSNSSSGLAVGSAMAAAVARASTGENPTLSRRTADVST